MTARRSNTTLPEQFLRYCIVGGIGTCMHFGITIALVEAAGSHPTAASVVGFAAAFVTSYLLNRFWVFGPSLRPWVSFVRYSIVCACGLALNVSIMALTVDWLRWYYLWGLAVVVAVVPVTNFALNRHWAFPSQRTDAKPV
jgi:putative flippase GtrA